MVDTLYIAQNSTSAFGYGLSRSFQEYMKIDINKDAEFMQSRKIFAAVIVDTKRQGFGGVGSQTIIFKYP